MNQQDLETCWSKFTNAYSTYKNDNFKPKKPKISNYLKSKHTQSFFSPNTYMSPHPPNQVPKLNVSISLS